MKGIILHEHLVGRRIDEQVCSRELCLLGKAVQSAHSKLLLLVRDGVLEALVDIRAATLMALAAKSIVCCEAEHLRFVLLINQRKVRREPHIQLSRCNTDPRHRLLIALEPNATAPNLSRLLPLCLLLPHMLGRRKEQPVGKNAQAMTWRVLQPACPALESCLA